MRSCSSHHRRPASTSEAGVCDMTSFLLRLTRLPNGGRNVLAALAVSWPLVTRVISRRPGGCVTHLDDALRSSEALQEPAFLAGIAQLWPWSVHLSNENVGPVGYVRLWFLAKNGRE